MKRYLRLYKAIFSINISQFFVYRADSILSSFVTSGVWASFNIFSIYLITLKINGAYGWSAGELILISSIYNVIIGLFGGLFMKSINDFSHIIDKGRLEYFLLKPINSQLYISTHTIEVRHIMRTALGVFFIFMTSHYYNIPISPFNVVFFCFTIVFALGLLYSCLFILNTLVVWSPSMNNINELFYSLRPIGRYPREMFVQISTFVFVFFAPFVIFISTPTKVLLGRASLYEVSELFFLTMFLLWVSSMFWKFALKHYTSASG